MKRFVLISTLALIAIFGFAFAKGPRMAAMTGQANGAQMGEQIRLRDSSTAGPGQQNRFQQRDQDCPYATDPDALQSQTQDRLQLRDGTCLVTEDGDVSTPQIRGDQLRLRDPSLHTAE